MTNPATVRDHTASRTVAGHYVYGIVPAGTVLPAHLTGVGSTRAELRLVPWDGIAAVVSEVSEARALGSRRDLLAHARVLDTLAAGTPVLPARFGMVLPDADTVTGQLLEPRHDDLMRALATVAGRAQFIVSARHVSEAVLREVVAEDVEIMRLREVVAHAADRDTRFRLGELVAHALDRKRATDAQRLHALLGPYAVALVDRPVTGADQVASVAFLVGRDEQESFVAAAEALAASWAGRARVRLLGPLAAYDFTDALLAGSA